MSSGGSSPMPKPTVPEQRTVGRYELLGRIASGGMATVYLARVRGLGGFARTVALKLCHPHLREDEEFATMFLDEARLAATIHHPNVVATLDVGRDEALYMVMEYIEGGRLSDLVRASNQRGGALALPIVARILVDALTGLHAAHEVHDDTGNPLGLVHRDVSPQNILVGVDGVTRIADFGIAKAAARATVTRTGQIKGKLSYMAPEQLTGVEIDRRADVFAAGVVLWEAAVGRRLFAGNSDMETTSRVLHGSISPPSTQNPMVPPALDAVVMAALERGMANRTPSAMAMAEQIERAVPQMASTREVAECVRTLLREQLEKHQMSLTPRGDAPPEASGRAPAKVSEPEGPVVMEHESGEVISTIVTGPETSLPGPRPLRWVPVAVGVTLAVVGAATLFFLHAPARHSTSVPNALVVTAVHPSPVIPSSAALEAPPPEPMRAAPPSPPSPALPPVIPSIVVAPAPHPPQRVAGPSRARRGRPASPPSGGSSAGEFIPGGT